MFLITNLTCYIRSSKRQSRLKMVYSILDQKCLKVKAIHEVRWLSRAEAVLTLLKCYNALQIYFDETAEVECDPGASGIYKALTDTR